MDIQNLNVNFILGKKKSNNAAREQSGATLFSLNSSGKKAQKLSS